VYRSRQPASSENLRNEFGPFLIDSRLKVSEQEGSVRLGACVNQTASGFLEGQGIAEKTPIRRLSEPSARIDNYSFGTIRCLPKQRPTLFVHI